MLSEVYREHAVATLCPDKKHCYACANVLDVRAELCPRCGVRQPLLVALPRRPYPRGSSQHVPTTRKSRVTAALLALILGGLGIHKFYLGRVAAGLLHLVLCWTLIPSVIGVVDAIVLLAMADDTFSRRYPA